MKVRTLAFIFGIGVSQIGWGDVALTKLKTIDQFRVVNVATAYSGGLIAMGLEDKSVRVFDLNAMTTRFQCTGHPRPPQALAFNRQGTLLATGDETARLFVWDMKSGKKVREFPREKGHTKGIIAISFSADGSKIATVGDDDVIKVWKTAGGNPIGTILGGGANLYGVAWTPSGALLTGTLADGLRIYNGQTFALVSKMPVPGGQGVNSIAATYDGTKAITAGRDGKLSAFTVSNRSRVFNSVGHSDWIMKVALSPNGRIAASSSSDRTVAIWNMTTGAKIQTIQDTSPIGSPVGFSGDGKFFIATTLSDGLQIFSVNPPQSVSNSTKSSGKKGKVKKK